MSPFEMPTLASPDVSKKKPVAESKQPERNRQVNFTAPPKLSADLDDIARAFGLDVANLVRLILNENIARYKQRAERIRSGLPAEEDDDHP